jgi:Sap-like sulfolipid-1-addressing protein
LRHAFLPDIEAMSFAQILPLSFVMIAGPQIISSFFFATSKHWAVNSLSYIGGAAVSVTTVTTIAYFGAKGGKSAGGGGSGTDTTLDWIILALLLVLIARVFMTRKTSEPPKWMGKLQDATPKLALSLGLLLLGIFPTDILTSITAGFHVARQNDPWWQILPFIAVTLTFLGGPALGVVLLGNRAHIVLPKVRDWMNDNSWVVSEIVLVFFVAITINSLVG